MQSLDSRRRSWQPAAAGWLLACLSGTANADVLVGANGERIPGTLIRLSGEWIEFDSILLGRIRVSASKARVESNDQGDAAPQALAPAPAERTPEQAASTWQGKLGLAAAVRGGSREEPKDNLDIAFNARRSVGPDLSTISLLYAFESESGTTKDDDWRVDLRHERETGVDRFYGGQLTTKSELDDGERQTLDILAGFAGWRLVDTDTSSIRIAPGYAWAAYEDLLGRRSVSGPAAYASWKLPWFMDTSFNGTWVFLIEPGGNHDYVTDLSTHLDKPINEHLSIQLGWQYQYSAFAVKNGNSSRVRWLLNWTF